MAVTFDAASAAQTFSPATSVTWSHTCTGTDRVVFVEASYLGYPSDATATATYDGVAMTSLGRLATAILNDGYAGWVQWFQLINPPTGAKNVVLTLSASSYGVCGSVSFTGASQTSPSGTPATASGTSNAPAVTVSSSTAGNQVLGGVMCGPNDNDVASVQTQAWLEQERTNTGYWGGAQYTGAGGSKTMSWTDNFSVGWGAMAFEILAAATPVAKGGTTAMMGV